ncbi:MAG: hypothetical protein ACEPOV_01045 [Hyphomicrobiales bacterium]
MNTIIESGITLNLPEDRSFRFENCKSYKEINGFSFKEMDACWYDNKKQTLYLVELKDYSQVPNTREKSRDLITNLVKKSTDSLQMVLAMLLDTEHGNKFQAEIGWDLPVGTSLKFISIIKTESYIKKYFQSLNQGYKTKFSPFKKLYNPFIDIKAFVINYDKAKEKFEWVK